MEGNQAADTLFFTAADPADRYSAVDTMRAQRNVYLGVGLEAPVHRRQRRSRRSWPIPWAVTTPWAVLAPSESNTVRYALEKRTMHACRDSYLLARGGA